MYACGKAKKEDGQRTERHDGKEKGKKDIPGRSYRFRIGIPLPTIASYFLYRIINTSSSAPFPSSYPCLPPSQLPSFLRPPHLLFSASRNHHPPSKRKKERKYSHITHADHIINLLNPHPMQHIRHERLEPHILNARDEFCRAEIFVCGVAAAFAEVVD